MPIKGVVFDFGGVLLSYQNLGEQWNAMDRDNGLPLGTIAEAAKGVEFSRWLDGRSLFHGSISIQEIEDEGLFTDFINQKYTLSIKKPLKPMSIALDNPNGYQYNEKMCKALCQLKSLGYKTALLTNNCFIDKAHGKQRLPFDLSVFDVVVESCIEAEVKPEPAIYEITRSRLSLNAEELVFLDDLKENCEAAKELGWKAIQVNPSDEAAAVQALESLLAVKFAHE